MASRVLGMKYNLCSGQLAQTLWHLYVEVCTPDLLRFGEFTVRTLTRLDVIMSLPIDTKWPMYYSCYHTVLGTFPSLQFTAALNGSPLIQYDYNSYSYSR